MISDMFNYEYFFFVAIGLVWTVILTKKKGKKYLFLLIPTFVPFVNFLMVGSLTIESLFFGYAGCLGWVSTDETKNNCLTNGKVMNEKKI